MLKDFLGGRIHRMVIDRGRVLGFLALTLGMLFGPGFPVAAQRGGRIIASVVNSFPDSDNGSVMFLDALTSTLAGSPVIVETLPTMGVASPNGRWFYVVNLLSSSLTIIHASQRVITHLCLSTGCPPNEPRQFVRPSAVAVTPDGGRVLVTKFGSPGQQPQGSGLAVINARTNQLLADIPLLGSPFDIVVAPEGNRAYVTMARPGGGWQVGAIDLTRGVMTEVIPMGQATFSIALARDGRTLYALDWEDHRLRLIDASLNRIQSMVDVGVAADGLSLSPDGSKIYISHRDQQGVWVLDAQTLDVLSRIAPGVPSRATVLRRLAISPDGTLGYVVNPNNNNVTVLDLINNRVRGQIAVGENPVAVAFFVRPEELVEQEPNDTLAQAQNLLSSFPLVVKGTLRSVMDADVYAVEARGGQQLIADIDAHVLGATVDTIVTVIDETGNVVAENDDFDGSRDAYLMAAIPRDGRYFIRVATQRTPGFQPAYELVVMVK